MTQKDEPELVTSGPYHLVRHPIYSGILVAGVGTAVALSWMWLIAVALAGRVREVIAHMTMAARYSEEEFMAELRRCDFDFGRLSNEIAARDAELPASELVVSLRSELMQHWTPPGGGWHGALNHVVIHGLDVTVPLGVPRRSPDATIRVVLDDMTSGDVAENFGTSIQGRSLQATDLDWSFGSGPALRGPAEDLALVLCGRAVPGGRLHGDPL